MLYLCPTLTETPQTLYLSMLYYSSIFCYPRSYLGPHGAGGDRVPAFTRWQAGQITSLSHPGAIVWVKGEGELVKTPHRIKKKLCCGVTFLSSATCTLAHHVYPNGFCLFLATVHVHFVSLNVKGKELPVLAAFSGFIFCLSSLVHWLWSSAILHLTVGKKKIFFSSFL